MLRNHFLHIFFSSLFSRIWICDDQKWFFVIHFSNFNKFEIWGGEIGIKSSVVRHSIYWLKSEVMWSLEIAFWRLRLRKASFFRFVEFFTRDLTFFKSSYLFEIRRIILLIIATKYFFQKSLKPRLVRVCVVSFFNFLCSVLNFFLRQRERELFNLALHVFFMVKINIKLNIIIKFE